MTMKFANYWLLGWAAFFIACFLLSMIGVFHPSRYMSNTAALLIGALSVIVMLGPMVWVTIRE